ncbi:ABC transporter permease [Thorsellia kenyensis]|uniref:ABC transporter permease n=1 Tax=Thorsellia kenyensis TaxID=1549888 RepID=A0ABV6CDB9_9GAMM
MGKFFIKRILVLFPTFLGITLLTFILVKLIPGDPVEIMMGDRGLSPEAHSEAIRALGLDKPFIVQYFNYLKDILSGNFGVSFSSKTPVISDFLTLFPATIELTFFAMLFAIGVGVPLGVLAAVKSGSFFDNAVMAISLTGFSLPIFWFALIMILFFSVTLGWTPVSGRISNFYYIEPYTGFMLIDSIKAQLDDPEFSQGAFLSALHHLLLPSIVLGTIPLAIISRMTRSSMLEVLKEDYVRTAYAKGLSPRKVIFGHALKNALIPVITVIGLSVSSLLGGAVLTETIFSWPGIGKWLIDSISKRDYVVVQNGILLIACVVILTNFFVDILYGIINPKMRQLSN